MAANSAKPFSISLGGGHKARSKPAQPFITKKRPHSALGDPDSDHEEHAQPQLVTGFDQSTGGAVSALRVLEKGPLVIKSLSNRDWREESRRKRGKKNLLPAEVQAAKKGGSATEGQGAVTVERDVISAASGLQFVKQDENDDAAETNEHGRHISRDGRAEPSKEKTADEEAIEELLGKEKESTLVIQTLDTVQNGNDAGHEATESEDYLNENDRYRADVASRPNSCTLEQYEQIPVEEFGAAMLRGMGANTDSWSAKSNGRKDTFRVVERRPALLGIGAKEIPDGLGEDLGAWGKPAKGKRKTEMAYSPVMMKNAKTGELLTEEELKKKTAEANDKPKREEDWRQRRDRNLADDGERKRERLAIEDTRNGDSGLKQRSRSRDRRRRENDWKDDRRERDNVDDRDRYSSSRRQRSRTPERSRRKESRRERSRSRDRDRNDIRQSQNDHERRHRDRDRYNRDGHRR